MNSSLEEVVAQFCFDCPVISCRPYGEGHINGTYLAVSSSGHRYILQKINRSVFPDVAALMENISAVTAFLLKKTQDPRGVLKLIPTTRGAAYVQMQGGDCWRAFDFVEDAICLQSPETKEDFYQSALAFGNFQNQLADFPAETLHETIKNFHDTVASALIDLQRQGLLPLRVTHNDTKLNNVMLDARTRKALCVIDLDTVMPGLSLYDFGDSIRFGAATAREDEKDLSKVEMSLELYDIYTRGFLEACPSLTDMERRMFPMGAKLMTLECGVRFLTDYLEGDHYYATHYEEQNLFRCRTQLKLVADMEEKWEKMIVCSS